MEDVFEVETNGTYIFKVTTDKEKERSKKIEINVEEIVYTITYNANGGSGAPDPQTKSHGYDITLSNTIPTKSGYEFVGWSTSSTATTATYTAGSKFSSNEDTTLYAVWKLSYSNITAKMVAENPEIYYGLKVTNYTSVNGQSDWKIFYSDWKEKSEEQNTDNPTDTHIFLITGDYIDTTETDRIDSATGMTTPEKKPYSVSWDSLPAFQTVDSTTLTRFKATEYELQSGISNSKCVSTLLNDNNWSSYKDSGNKAEKAIGGSTVEMWMDSWNARYPGDKLYRKASTSKGNPGYYVGTSQNPSSTSIGSRVMSAKEGYNNKLYYPHTSDSNGTLAYWLASPSADTSGGVLHVDYRANVGNAVMNTNIVGVRPVVSLNFGITVNAEDAE